MNFKKICHEWAGVLIIRDWCLLVHVQISIQCNVKCQLGHATKRMVFGELVNVMKTGQNNSKWTYFAQNTEYFVPVRSFSCSRCIHRNSWNKSKATQVNHDCFSQIFKWNKRNVLANDKKWVKILRGHKNLTKQTRRAPVHNTLSFRIINADSRGEASAMLVLTSSWLGQHI